MKIRKVLLSLFSTLACVTVAQAGSQPQMYVGVQGGYADTNFGLSTMVATADNGSVQLTSASIKNHVFAGRAYAGYQFNEYVALEAGFLKPHSTRYTQINNSTIPTGNVSEYGIDITGKIFLPMAAYIHLSPYLKAGGIYMDGQSHGGITRNGASDFGYSTHPLFGAGVGYNFTPNMTGDLSWTTITKRNSQLPRIDMFFLGLTYHFALKIPNLARRIMAILIIMTPNH